MHDRGRETALGRAVHRLDPADFSAVMATGIVSEAMHVVGLDVASVPLLVLAAAAYLLLVAATTWRLARWPQAALTDAEDPARGFGYLTFVAATGVLASRLAVDRHVAASVVLVAVALIGWLALSYLVPAVLVLHRSEQPVLGGVTGGWFMWVVSAQSIAVGCADLARIVHRHPSLLLLSLAAWSVGVLLYLLVSTLVVVALLRRPVRAEALTPSYWIFMGGTAISVLAGSRILQVASDAPFDRMRPAVEGISMLLWSFGTWLVPLLVVGSVWRHARRGRHRTYEVGLWSVVFPLGMYDVASSAFAGATGLPWLGAIGVGAAWVSLAVWLLVAAALIASVTPRRVRAGSRRAA
jgi:tellurite resistance protein TehA-like permease